MVSLEWMALAVVVIFLSAGLVYTIHESVRNAATNVGTNTLGFVNSNS